jgi:hypothetical protein
MPEWEGNGTAHGPARLAADEAIEAVLKLDMDGVAGWELTPDARAQLNNIVKRLKAQRLAQGAQEQSAVAGARARC